PRKVTQSPACANAAAKADARAPLRLRTSRIEAPISQPATAKAPVTARVRGLMIASTATAATAASPSAGYKDRHADLRSPRFHPSRGPNGTSNNNAKKI